MKTVVSVAAIGSRHYASICAIFLPPWLSRSMFIAPGLDNKISYDTTSATRMSWRGPKYSSVFETTGGILAEWFGRLSFGGGRHAHVRDHDIAATSPVVVPRSQSAMSFDLCVPLTLVPAFQEAQA